MMMAAVVVVAVVAVVVNRVHAALVLRSGYIRVGPLGLGTCFACTTRSRRVLCGQRCLSGMPHRCCCSRRLRAVSESSWLIQFLVIANLK